MKKVPRKASKRVPLKLKHNIEKRVKKHEAKLRREARKMGKKARVHRDPPIPNSCPFKAELIENF
jgi:nuclear GTP-binding protein